MKRYSALQLFSKKHRVILGFCLHLEKGLKQNIKVERMQLHCIWFWDNHLKKHFLDEGQYVFPLLPSNDKIILQAVEEHKAIESICRIRSMSNLNLIELITLLRTHIRFEERVLFNAI